MSSFSKLSTRKQKPFNLIHGVLESGLSGNLEKRGLDAIFSQVKRAV